jgi:hypothetical protein
MRLADVFDPVYARIGWRPVSSAIKPVHLANGLFRSLLGERRDISDTVALIVPWRRKGAEADPERTHAGLTEGDPRYTAYAGEARRPAFELLREHLRGLLAADGAAFPSAEHSSLTVSCGRMVSGDPNDRNLGRFMASLISGSHVRPGLLADVLSRAARDDGLPADPISRAAWPLLSERAISAAPPARAASAPDGFAARMADASDCLAAHEAAHGNRLASMRRGVTFCCLGLVAHAQWLPCGGDPGLRTPLLAEVGAARRSRIAVASSASLAALHSAFERWIVDALAESLADGSAPCPLPPPDCVGLLLASLADDKGAPPDAETVEVRLAHHEQAAAAGRGWAWTVARTLFLCHQSESASGGPRQFVEGIARRCGLVHPHFQGGDGDRRVRPAPLVLDTLVRSCVPAGHMAPLPEFLSTLWERFGLVVGGRGADDEAALRRSGAEVGPADLEGNSRAFVATLETLGLACRRPDGVAHVGAFDG